MFALNVYKFVLFVDVIVYVFTVRSWDLDLFFGPYKCTENQIKKRRSDSKVCVFGDKMVIEMISPPHIDDWIRTICGMVKPVMHDLLKSKHCHKHQGEYCSIKVVDVKQLGPYEQRRDKNYWRDQDLNPCRGEEVGNMMCFVFLYGWPAWNVRSHFSMKKKPV